MNIKPMLLLSLCIYLTACTDAVGKDELNECDLKYRYNQAVFNNLAYRNNIREDFRECLKGNSNRDVTYNDSNELVNSCRKIAIELNGGVEINKLTGPDKLEVSKTEARLRKCGYFKSPL